MDPLQVPVELAPERFPQQEFIMVSSDCPVPPQPPAHEEFVLPEIQENAEISTRTIETGVLRISKHVHDVERTFNPTLHDQRFRVDRVPINRIVKSAPEVRTEGETTIIPIVEEVMVKLLILKEEVRVTRELLAKPGRPENVLLRREEVAVERLPAASSADGKAGEIPSAAPAARSPSHPPP